MNLERKKLKIGYRELLFIVELLVLYSAKWRTRQVVWLALLQKKVNIFNGWKSGARNDFVVVSFLEAHSLIPKKSIWRDTEEKWQGSKTEILLTDLRTLAVIGLTDLKERWQKRTGQENFGKMRKRKENMSDWRNKNSQLSIACPQMLFRLFIRRLFSSSWPSQP